MLLYRMSLLMREILHIVSKSHEKTKTNNELISLLIVVVLKSVASLKRPGG